MDRYAIDEAKRNEILKKQQHSLRQISQSVEIGRQTISELSLQSETLDRSERLADDNAYMVDRSARIMRGMTWSGWIYNKFSKAPQPVQEGGEITGFICPDCKQSFDAQTELLGHHNKAHSNIQRGLTGASRVSDSVVFDLKARDASHKENLDRSSDPLHGEFLNNLELQLEELNGISSAIGTQLMSQNEQLESIDSKTDRTQDEMRRITVKASKIMNKPLSIQRRFRLAFQEVNTGLYIQVLNGLPSASSDVVSRDCTFQAYTVDNTTDIWGFQFEKSRNFFGLTYMGSVKVQGQAFKSYEQFNIDINQATTPIFSFASYFGYGGWVCVGSEHNLFTIRGTAENKSKAARFKILRLDDIE